MPWWLWLLLIFGGAFSSTGAIDLLYWTARGIDQPAWSHSRGWVLFKFLFWLGCIISVVAMSGLLRHD